MIINYAQIGVLAAERQRKLEAVQAKLQKIAAVAGDLIGALNYFVELQDMVAALDSEGKNLVGLDTVDSIGAVGGRCRYLGSELNQPISSMRKLIQTVEAP